MHGISERVGIPVENCIKRYNIHNLCLLIPPPPPLVHFPTVVLFSAPATKTKDSTVKITYDLEGHIGS